MAKSVAIAGVIADNNCNVIITIVIISHSRHRRRCFQCSVIQYVCDVAVTCPTLVFRVVSSTRTSVGTLVNVSCPAGQKLQTGHNATQTVCSRSGDWSPAVPDCVSK